MAQAPDAPHYHYDQKLGDPNDAYTPRRPEMPAAFVASVDGETIINTMWGKRIVPWRADPGTQCVILGNWADGTLQLRWPAIRGAYRVEGRFPSWVVVEDPEAKMAGGGHVLPANNPAKRGPTLVQRALAFAARVIHISHAAFA